MARGRFQQNGRNRRGKAGVAVVGGARWGYASVVNLGKREAAMRISAKRIGVGVMAAGIFVGAAWSRQAAPPAGAAQDAAAGPAEKYGFKPTAEMNTFGHVVIHIAQSNYSLCSKLSGSAAPEVKLADTDGKDKLVAGLKDSFAFCTTVLANADDAKLGEQIPLFGGKMMPRAVAWIALSDGWNDHYGALAVYLRLNGILPPTAQPAGH